MKSTFSDENVLGYETNFDTLQIFIHKCDFVHNTILCVPPKNVW